MSSLIIEPIREKKKYIFDEKRRVYESIIIFAQIILYPTESRFALGVQKYDIQTLTDEYNRSSICYTVGALSPEIALMVATKGLKSVKSVSKLTSKLKKKRDTSEKSPHKKRITRIGGQSSGNKPTNFNGNEVRQNNNFFDPNRIDDKGRTNIQLMENGLAPIGTDGKSINLHHVDQTPTGPIQEILATDHRANYSDLHSNTGQSPSLMDRNAFNSWRDAYWKWRAGGFK